MRLISRSCLYTLHRFCFLSLLISGVLLPGIHNVKAQTTHVVTSAADNGPGSLRQLIMDAASGDSITFDASLAGQSIDLTTGPLFIDHDLHISGPGPDASGISIDAGGQFRVILIDSSLVGSLSTMTITGGSAVDNGGGVWIGEDTRFVITNAVITGNRAMDNGGGIYVSAGAHVAIDQSTISDNEASGDLSPNGGGLYNLAGVLTVEASRVIGNRSIRGGGIWNSSGGTMRVTNSLVAENRATLEGGGIYNNSKFYLESSTVSDNQAEAEAGAIRNRTGDTLTVLNSTISGNQAPRTGGLVNFTASTVLLYNSTLFGNQADEPGAGLRNEEEAKAFLYSTIVAANLRDGTVHSDILDDGAGVQSMGYNLIGERGNVQTVSTDLSGTASSPFSPRLGPLAENGGVGLTHAPEPGSLIIDQGDCELTELALDQRGAVRIVDQSDIPDAGDGCDIGAVELDVVNVGIDDTSRDIPTSPHITSAFPNPAHAEATFFVTLPSDQYLRIELYNAAGQRIRTLYDGILPGRSVHAISINKGLMAPGLYFYRVAGENWQESRSVLFVQ